LNKKFSLIFFLLFLTGCIQQEGDVQRYSETTFCTRDLNEWGHASKCKCKQETAQYDQKIGKCINE